MALNSSYIKDIIDLKTQDAFNRGDPKFKGNYFTNADIAEQIIGSRKAESSVRRIWKEYKQKGHYRGVIGQNPVASGSVSTSEVTRKVLTGKKYIVTSVQNNTHIHEDFFESLLRYCKEEGAELLISSFYYNKSGFNNGIHEGVWFDERVKPYLVNESLQLCKGLVFSAELNLLPTAINPISGLHNYTTTNSMIIPHAKLQLESVPTKKHDDAKLIYTTGTVSKRNYRQCKAGQKAEFDHTFSALVVEVNEDSQWFVRQLNCESETGNFYDLDKYYTKNEVTSGHSIEAVNYGDLHGISIAPEVEHACWDGEGNILDTLKPKYQFLHDSLSNERRNHHNMKDCLYLFSQYSKNAECVREEVELTTKLIAKLDRPYSERIVVDSNHDRSLQRFILDQDFKKDPVNAIFMLELTLDLYKAVESGADFHMFENACRRVDPRMNDVRFLRRDEQFTICGDIECGSHSDDGANGSRGSIQGFQKASVRYNIGHSHQVNIKQGVYQAGMSGSLEQSYNHGNSSWSWGHILTYKNGKRAIVVQRGNKWRG